MIIVKKHLTNLSTFRLFARGRKCKQRCGECGNPWDVTGTQMVSQKDTFIKRRGKYALKESTWICDGCATQYPDPEK